MEFECESENMKQSWTRGGAEGIGLWNIGVQMKIKIGLVKCETRNHSFP